MTFALLPLLLTLPENPSRTAGTDSTPKHQNNVTAKTTPPLHGRDAIKIVSRSKIDGASKMGRVQMSLMAHHPPKIAHINNAGVSTAYDRPVICEIIVKYWPC